ncbi:hypothetical protein HUG10_20650 (plasmid) [Halorarum halophilum]|uniref:Uncharacterized protein n=1 Tax=Halorarum halophilum TaxID=2743090 RepID=A0A7D5KAQ3_9EURY|nr:hypothetical protein [Halobaculum halophilum]QLG30019.1 hypothetical protein HUG10_20650 [Halobaculum halophilum]
MKVEQTYTTDEDEQRWLVDMTNDEYQAVRKLLAAEMEYQEVSTDANR